MTPVTKNPITAALFLGSGTFLTVGDFLPLVGFFLLWLGAVQLMNAAAPKLPFKSFFHWAHAMTFELFSFAWASLLRLTPCPTQIVGKGRPILLIHGYIHQDGVWRVQKKRLEKLGYGPIFTISLKHSFLSIKDYAQQVKAKADFIAEKTGRKDLVLIGHSMGGLVSAWYAAKHDTENNVAAVITVGSPLAGTPLAYIGLGPNAREMRPGSPFLQELQEAISQNPKIQFYHIATRTDQIVIPGLSGIVPANQHLIIDDIGHVTLLYSRRVTAQIHNWLQTILD